MKKLNKVALLFASAALAASASRRVRPAPTSRSTTGSTATASLWKNGTNELCWRDANWTPATAHPVATAP